MKANTFEVRFLTPAMLAGAYPKSTAGHKAAAEIRAASIRGLLRWWFRFLGHDRATEERIFGHAAGDDGHASGFTLRVLKSPEPVIAPKAARDIGLRNGPVVEYLAFNLRKSEDARSMFEPGTIFHFSIINRRLTLNEWDILIETARVFCHLGSIGTRARRGFGALELVSENGRDASLPSDLCKMLGSQLTAQAIDFTKPCGSPTSFLIECGNWLREKRSSLGRAKTQLFGTAGRSSRLASPILLRPIRHKSHYKLLAIGRTSDLKRALIC